MCRSRPPSGRPRAAPADRDTVVHLLNRVTFGARAEDVDRVERVGVERYIDEQLRPELLADDAVEARVRDLRAVAITPRAFALEYYQPMVVARREFTEAQRLTGASRAPFLRWHLLPILALSLPGGDRPMTVVGQPAVTPEDARFQRMNQQVFDEMQAQKLLRAVMSERQLQEVLTDFWFNHFNIDARKIEERPVTAAYERDVIRPRVLGRFRDLLEATATSPAMLFYLDNWLSAAPKAKGPGLNENYGRELLELHTLGVNGGYTQRDVVEVARCFTGWSMANPHDGMGFAFKPQMHDRGEKRVLGHRIKRGGGIDDGEAVLDLLARHPSTARFIATKLVRRFVSDVPPPRLADEAARTFRRSNGDLREVMRTILISPEFYAPAARRAKMKSPLEFVASALRASDATIRNPRPFVSTIANLGEPLYQSQPPTGYLDRGDVWLNTGALVDRMNFAFQFASFGLNAATIDRPSAEASLRRLLPDTAADDPSPLLCAERRSSPTVRTLMVARPNRAVAPSSRTARSTPATIASPSRRAATPMDAGSSAVGEHHHPRPPDEDRPCADDSARRGFALHGGSAQRGRGRS